jgi:hypothetical protein
MARDGATWYSAVANTRARLPISPANGVIQLQNTTNQQVAQQAV